MNKMWDIWEGDVIGILLVFGRKWKEEKDECWENVSGIAVEVIRTYPENRRLLAENWNY